MDKNTLEVETHERHYTFRAVNKSLLHKTIFLIANLVWPDWYSDEKGQKQYMGYANADDVKKGMFNFHKNALNKEKFEKVLRHIELDGHQISIDYATRVELGLEQEKKTSLPPRDMSTFHSSNLDERNKHHPLGDGPQTKVDK